MSYCSVSFEGVSPHRTKRSICDHRNCEREIHGTSMESNEEVTRNSTKVTPEIRSHEHGFERAFEQKTYGAVR